jgi:hypothetical protein
MYEAPLAARQLGEQRQFQPRYDRLNSSQMMAVNGNLVRREYQLEMLFVAATGEFREDELIVRQQQRMPRRNINAQSLCLWVTSPTFGCFCAHVFVC